MIEKSLLEIAPQHLGRSTRRHERSKSPWSGTVQKDRIEMADSKQLHASFEPAFHRLAAVVARDRGPADLRLNERASRQSAQLFQRQADAPLALTVSIPARGVDVVEWAGSAASTVAIA